MTTEEEVCAATMRFYDGINDMATGKGLGAIEQAWEHSDRVTAGHPTGDWCEGWEEVLAVYKMGLAFARPDRGGSKVRDMKAQVYGDVAYTTCLFTTQPAFGAETVACTNVLYRIDGAWKIVHFHADKAPALEAAAEKMARED